MHQLVASFYAALVSAGVTLANQFISVGAFSKVRVRFYMSCSVLKKLNP
jgi:hypothetical protein